MVEKLQISVLDQSKPIPVFTPGSHGIASNLRPIVAIGKFDGAHLGHRALADEARRSADRLGGFTLALTFSPHPRRYFSPDQPFFQLMPDEMRPRRLKDIGFDALAILSFNEKLASLSAENFLRETVHDTLKAQAVVVGEDFRFGANRRGNAGLIAAMAEELGLEARFVAPQTLPSGRVISSSAIRECLGLGDLDQARAMLGYDYTVESTVIHGEKRGRTLGYPTANLALDPSCGLKHGIYAVRIQRGETTLQGVASFGRRPTFDNGAPLLEVHIFDFSQSLYGESLAISFHAFLREELKFTSLEALIKQMDADSLKARALLNKRAA